MVSLAAAASSSKTGRAAVNHKHGAISDVECAQFIQDGAKHAHKIHMGRQHVCRNKQVGMLLSMMAADTHSRRKGSALHVAWCVDYKPQPSPYIQLLHTQAEGAGRYLAHAGDDAVEARVCNPAHSQPQNQSCSWTMERRLMWQVHPLSQTGKQDLQHNMASCSTLRLQLLKLKWSKVSNAAPAGAAGTNNHRQVCMSAHQTRSKSIRSSPHNPLVKLAAGLHEFHSLLPTIAEHAGG